MAFLASLDPRNVPPSAPADPDWESPLINRRSTILGLTISFMIVSWVCVLLRLYTRFVIQRKPGWDDVFIILTMLSTSVGTITVCLLTDMGIGKHIHTLTLDEAKRFLLVLYIGGASFPLSVTLIKVALLFQYLRIFEAGSRYALLCKLLIALTAVWGLTYCILTWIPCYPVAAYWDPTIAGTCWAFGSHDPYEFLRAYVSQAIINAILDIVIFLLPVRLYFKPDAERKTRLSLLALFALGLSVNCCSLWRMANVLQVDPHTLGTVQDPTWSSPTPAVLSCIEVHLAAVCAALPVLWPVLKHGWQRIFVTYEVHVTREERPEITAANELELKTSSDQHLELGQASTPEDWDPWVGDETSGLGESETVVETRVPGTWRTKVKTETYRPVKTKSRKHLMESAE